MVDLRHVRYVALAPEPPDGAPTDLSWGGGVVRNALLGGFAGGALTLHVTGRAASGVALGVAVGAASAVLAQWRRGVVGRSFALVPWGVLVDDERDLAAVRWSGVRTLDVRYSAARDGSVHARVAVDCVVGSFVGFASDAVDLGALAGDLDAVAIASSRPLALDLEGAQVSGDGEPFVERVLDGARTFLACEGDCRLGLEPTSYRASGSPATGGEERVARALRTIGADAAVAGAGADPWGLVAAVAGELRLTAFGRELARLANNPHPGVAAFARAALGRLPSRNAASRTDASRTDATRIKTGRRDEPIEELDARDGEETDALAWFLPPDELTRLRAWRDAPA